MIKTTRMIIIATELTVARVRNYSCSQSIWCNSHSTNLILPALHEVLKTVWAFFIIQNHLCKRRSKHESVTSTLWSEWIKKKKKNFHRLLKKSSKCFFFSKTSWLWKKCLTLKMMGYSYRRAHRGPHLSAINMKLGLHFTQTNILKTLDWNTEKQ